MTTTTTKSAEALEMPIADRLEHCAKFTGLDAVRELLIEAAAAVRKRDAVVKLLEGERQARAQGQGEPSVDQLRELLSAHKLAAVPMRATHAMLDVMSDEDWQWADLLAAAEAITEDEYEWIERTPQPAQATQAEVTDADILEAASPFGAFEYGDAQGDKRIAFARTILALHTATQPCGHPASLVIRSAESGETLYCEACDDKSGRRDAEMREGELLEANQKLRDEILALRPERVPMTDEQIRSMCKQEWVFETARQWVHVIESHHGITAQAKKENQTAKRRSASA